MNQKPTVSIIMGIYNCAETLGEAIECILHQTFSDWELIMCDDGSRDNTLEVARQYMQQDPRIRVIRNPANLGLNKTLNNCLAEAHGQFIARMDGDDLCDPTRLEKEMKVLQEHPEYDIVSTEMGMFDADGQWGKTNYKVTPQPMDFIHGSQFCHAACLVRKEAYDAVGGYSVDKTLLRVEDYHLWVKMYAKGYRGYNIKEVLYMMRDDRNATVRRTFQNRVNEVHVKRYAIRALRLPLFYHLYCLRPIFLGLMPIWIYKILHKSNKK